MSETLKEKIARLEKELQTFKSGKEDAPEASFHAYDGEGLPPHLRVKRPYTLSADAIRQRREAATSANKAKAMEGNKNAWIHGKYAEGFLRQSVAPCKSTCEHYEDCEWVKNEETSPGGVCLDRAADFLKVLGGVQTAMNTGNLDDFKAIASVKITGVLEIIDMLVSDIKFDGTLMKSDIFGKDGKTIGQKIVSHPSLKPLADLIDSMELTPQQFMITPKSVKDDDRNKEKEESLIDKMLKIGSAFRKKEKNGDPA